jgi:dihydroorotate dehydrogenase
VLLKIAPDLSLPQLDAIVRVVREARIDGMIVSNTTTQRPAPLRSPHAKEAGGLSGAPLFALSTRLLAQVFLRVEGQFPLIGVGGVDSPEAALAKLEAGATLVQLYTALIFDGPSLAPRIKRGLGERLARDNIALEALVGCKASALARE